MSGKTWGIKAHRSPFIATGLTADWQRASSGVALAYFRSSPPLSRLTTRLASLPRGADRRDPWAKGAYSHLFTGRPLQVGNRLNEARAGVELDEIEVHRFLQQGLLAAAHRRHADLRSVTTGPIDDRKDVGLHGAAHAGRAGRDDHPHVAIPSTFPRCDEMAYRRRGEQRDHIRNCSQRSNSRIPAK